MNGLIERAQYYRAHQNTVKQFRLRGYEVPSRYDVSFQQFCQLLVQSEQDSLVKHALTIIARNPRVQSNSTTEILCPENIPNIETVISAVLSLHDDDDDDDDEEMGQLCNKLNVSSTYNETTRRNVLRLGDQIEFERADPNEVVALFVTREGGSIGKEAMIQLRKYQLATNIQHMKLIIHNEIKPFDPCTAKVAKTIREWSKFPRVEIEAMFSVCNDRSLCVDKPCCTILGDVEKHEILRILKAREEQMSTIKVTDPFAIYYDLPAGVMVKLVHRSGNTTYAVIGIDK